MDCQKVFLYILSAVLPPAIMYSLWKNHRFILAAIIIEVSKMFHVSLCYRLSANENDFALTN